MGSLLVAGGPIVVAGGLLGFLRAPAGNEGRDELWLNNGRGIFSFSGQRLGDGETRALFLGDLNGDGHADLLVVEEMVGLIWLNDGSGNFRHNGQQLSYEQYDAIATGDVNGDGRIDMVVDGVDAYQIWRGEGDGRFTADPSSYFR